MSYFSRFLFTLVFVSSLFLCVNQAKASGFMLNEYSVTGMGRAFAGSGIVGDDLSAIAVNAAGLSFIEDTFRVQAGVTFVSLGAEFDGTSSAINPLDGSTIYSSKGKASANLHGVVPNFYAAYRLNDRFTFGLGVYAPFGLISDYDENSMLKYLAIKSDVQVIEIAPTVAVRVIGGLSLGVTLNAQHASAELSQKVPAALAGAPADVIANVKGSDWAFGVSAGIAYDFGKTILGDTTRIGLGYRSTVGHKLEGTMETSLLGTVVRTNDVTAKIDLPNAFTLSFYQKLNAPVAISATVKYVMWSSFKELAIEGSGSPAVEEDWKDTFSAHIGADWFVNEYWTIRCGLAYDQAPVKDAAHLTARLPDNDRYMVGVGMSFMPHKNWIIDVGYTHMFIPNRASNNTHAVFNQNGTYKFSSTDHLIGTQVQFKF